MKARLLLLRETLYLLRCTGEISMCSESKAQRFLLNFDSPDYYSAQTVWDDPVSMEDMEGNTIAYVSDSGTLCVENAEMYRTLILHTPSKYVTAEEFAELHQRTTSVVRRCCRNGRIEGAVLKGRVWLIPEGTPYPGDMRRK